MVWHCDIDKDLIFFQDGIKLLEASFILELKREIVVLNDQMHALKLLVGIVDPATLLLYKLIGYLDRTHVEFKSTFSVVQVRHYDQGS